MGSNPILSPCAAKDLSYGAGGRETTAQGDSGAGGQGPHLSPLEPEDDPINDNIDLGVILGGDL
jgi:hypothetical protein